MDLNDIVTKDNSPQGQKETESKIVSDERLQQFIGTRFGQRSETRERYADAIQACGSIGYLEMTIAEIAHMFGHTDQCLRNQLKRHYPEMMKLREQLRERLGMNKRPIRGVSASTEAKYAPAIELLRTTDMTIHEVATRCGLSTTALQSHVLFNHRDLAQQRMSKRLNAIDKNATGGMSGTGRPNAPREATAALYAEALEMYRTTDLTVAEIALKCNVLAHSFQTYLQRWWRSDIAVREKLRRERLEKQRREREEVGNRSRTALAAKKYTPALKLIEEGATYEEAAKALGLDADAENLYRWVQSNHPDVHRRERQNQVVVLPNGRECAKTSWAMFGEAVEAYLNTDESINQIAKRFDLRATSLGNFLRRKFPEAGERRRNKT